MASDVVEQVVSRAVGESYAAWAKSHPSLAAVIDRVALTERVVESLRDSTEYRAAVAEFYRARSELELLSRLADLAAPVIDRLLGG